MGLFSISCKKATYLSSKKEEGKLSWMEKIQLRSHMAICSLCRIFEQQSQIIANQAKHAECKDKLSDEVKSKMVDALNASK